MHTRFITLMRREWLQHRTGWLVLMVAPTLLLLVASFFDGSLQVNLQSNDAKVQLGQPDGTSPSVDRMPALLQMSAMIGITGVLTCGLALLAVCIQLPGLARRDQQDRSIEFWRSLPVPDSQAVGATLLAHLLALPWAALLAGLAGGLVIGTVLVVASHGLGAWFGLPWATLLAALVALVARFSVGLALGMAWAAPLLLLAMLASAGLRRWGVPVLGALLLVGVFWLDRQLPTPVVKPALTLLSVEALQALVYVRPLGMLEGLSVEAQAGATLQNLVGGLWQDTGYILREALRPAFAVAVAAAAAMFAGLVQLRRRSA